MTMKCPVCGEAELLKEVRDIPYTFQDQTMIIRGVNGEFCPSCGESILELTESNRVMLEMQTFTKQVKADKTAASA
jgi:HTH-type transcriptional regulator/antitoxin MqsA